MDEPLDKTETSAADAPQAAGPEPAAPAEPGLRPNRRSRIWLLTGISLCVTVMMVLLSMTNGSTATSSAVVAGVGLPAAPEAADVEPSLRVSSATVTPAARTSGPAPKWVVTAPSSARRTTAYTFEIAALDDIAVRKQRVRPILSLRCNGRATEAFVVTHTAASFEGSSRQHTVELSFDTGTPAQEMWDHSVDHDALFSPDGEALARRIARAQTMTFTFTPFNGQPTTSTFPVKGLAREMSPASKKRCGW